MYLLEKVTIVECNGAQRDSRSLMRHETIDSRVITGEAEGRMR